MSTQWPHHRVTHSEGLPIVKQHMTIPQNSKLLQSGIEQLALCQLLVPRHCHPSLRFIFSIIFIVSRCMYLHVGYVCMSSGTHRIFGPSGAGVTAVNCWTWVRNWTQVLRRSGKCSSGLSHLPSPRLSSQCSLYLPKVSWVDTTLPVLSVANQEKNGPWPLWSHHTKYGHWNSGGTIAWERKHFWDCFLISRNNQQGFKY